MLYPWKHTLVYIVPTTVNTYVQSMPLQFVLVHQNCAKSGEGNKLDIQKESVKQMSASGTNTSLPEPHQCNKAPDLARVDHQLHYKSTHYIGSCLIHQAMVHADVEMTFMVL